MAAALLRAAARRLGPAARVSVFAALGLPPAPPRPVCSSLPPLLWLLPGPFAPPGGPPLPSSFAPLF
ncbi:hypothetical protein C3R44_21400, partial [Mycobacterium tuberculosis]